MVRQSIANSSEILYCNTKMFIFIDIIECLSTYVCTSTKMQLCQWIWTSLYLNMEFLMNFQLIVPIRLLNTYFLPFHHDFKSIRRVLKNFNLFVCLAIHHCHFPSHYVRWQTCSYVNEHEHTSAVPLQAFRSARASGTLLIASKHLHLCVIVCTDVA